MTALTRCVLFAILQKYDFSSKSQLKRTILSNIHSCLRYCKSTIFQANHNQLIHTKLYPIVVCDTAKVRFFKQITTAVCAYIPYRTLFAILQKYDFSSKSQHIQSKSPVIGVVCDTAKVRFFKQITTLHWLSSVRVVLFAILQKYDFSSKSQPDIQRTYSYISCLRYCKSTIFQANHNID